MDDKINRLNALVKKYVDGLHPKINISKLSSQSASRWKHEYDLMKSNGTLEKLCMIKSEVFDELSYTDNLSTYTAHGPLTMYKKYIDLDISITASPTSITYFGQFAKHNTTITITELTSIDTFVIIDLFEVIKKVQRKGACGTFLTELREFIEKNNLSDFVKITVVKY